MAKALLLPCSTTLQPSLPGGSDSYQGAIVHLHLLHDMMYMRFDRLSTHGKFLSNSTIGQTLDDELQNFALSIRQHGRGIFQGKTSLHRCAFTALTLKLPASTCLLNPL